MKQLTTKKRKSGSKITTLFLLFFVQVVFFNGFLFAQTIIKEKVSINPKGKSVQLLKSAMADYSPIQFQLGGPRPFSFVIKSPSGSVSGSNAGFGELSSVIEVPAVNGDYKVTVNGWTEGQSNVGYSVTWLDPYGNTQWIAGYEMWFWFGGVREDSFKFSGIPEPPPPFDFSILLNEHLVYGTEESMINFWYQGDVVVDKSVTLTFAGSDTNVIFYDRDLQQNMGSTIITTLDNSENFSVKSKSVNIDYPKQITVIANSNGLQRTDSLTIVQPEYVSAYFEKENLSPGDTVNVIVKRVNAKYGYESDYPDTTHFEVGIKEGCGLGKILSAAGDTAKYFQHIQQPIRFIVANTTTEKDSAVMLRVGAPMIEEGDVVASLIIPMGKITQKNKNAVSQNMSVGAEQSVNKMRMLKALDETSCTVYEPMYKKNSVDAASTVNKGGCDLFKCETNNPPVAPAIIFDPPVVDNSNCSGSDYGYTGLFAQDKMIGSYSTDVCYNLSSKKWQLNYISNSSPSSNIHIKYYHGICVTKIKAKFPETLIYNVNEIKTIPLGKMKKAKDDFECLQYYMILPYGTTGIGYYEMFLAHENQHETDLKDLVSNVYIQTDFKNKFLSFSLSCEQAGGKENIAKKSAEDYVKKLIDELKSNINDKYDYLTYDINKYEMDTQRKVYDKLFNLYKHVIPGLKARGSK